MFGGAASAKTPDGVTPAAEDVCDPLKARGMTKGLYGLCVAYCEAHDSDMGTANSRAGRGALVRSERILANYNKMRKEGDLEMPCLKPVASAPDPVPPPVVQTCPCWTPAQAGAIDGVLSNGSPASGWSTGSGTSVCGATPEFPYLNENGLVGTQMEQTFIRAANIVSGTTQFKECQYYSLVGGGTVNMVLSTGNGTLTEEQLAACIADVLARQAALGVCQPTP